MVVRLTSSLPSFFTVPGEVPCDPALQVREPAAHPSCHLELGGAELPSSPGLPSLPQLRLSPCPSLFSLFDERLFTGVGSQHGFKGGSGHRAEDLREK